ncbi:MAG: methylaspartate mutase subunit E [Acidobacteriota bacterium]|nr:methylaspartate mutase subunit E [Acidobacteriota bacterium]
MSQAKPYRVLLGGIGGDSHSVGLNVLRGALNAAGYQVVFLGIQNHIEDFFRFAGSVHLVMVSSMDGHAYSYLDGFRDQQQQHRGRKPLWYLGGNFHAENLRKGMDAFREMGFDRVFVRHLDLDEILDIVARDLSSVSLAEPLPPVPPVRPETREGLIPDIRDRALSDHLFQMQRPHILNHWWTGSQARDLRANAGYLAGKPNFAVEQARTLSGRRGILIQPRCGVSLPQQQARIFQRFRRLGLNTLSYQVDSLTRNNNYKAAEEEIRESRKSGKSTINGFPMVNLGVETMRNIADVTGAALQARHSTRDPRLLAEIAYASGVTSYEGGAICYNIPYYKDYPLHESIQKWQYVDYLTARYYDRFGIVLDREFFGTLTATLIPPSLALAVVIIESILAVQQGVRSVSPGYAEQGNRIQDIAAIQVLGELTREWLDNMGYRNVQVNTVFHQYMAAFPERRDQAQDLIYQSAITARLSGATRVLTKTAVEALRIPSLEDNADAVGLVQQAVREADQLHLIPGPIMEEKHWIRREVECIITEVLYAGDGDLARGVVRAFDRGILDIPFAPSIHNRGDVITVRDREGAVRYYDAAALPFDREIKAYHADKILARASCERRVLPRDIARMVQEDVLRCADPDTFRWPLNRKPVVRKPTGAFELVPG